MKTHRIVPFLLIVVLALSAFGFSAPQQDAAAKVQPQLLALATQNPNQTVQVIVQKAAQTQGVEDVVTALGGKVTADLSIINALAAEMDAGSALKLAKSEAVRWVSLDAGIVSAASSDAQYTTWATAVGSVVRNQFSYADKIVDPSGVGPDRRYGYLTGNGMGSFTGFQAQMSPGYAITKVEAVFYVFTNSYSRNDLRIRTYVNDAETGRMSVNSSIFNSVVGMWHAGLVYVDITSTNDWKWSDFQNNLELYIEQAGFYSWQRVYYDAVGLRVTSAPAPDTSTDTLPAPSSTPSPTPSVTPTPSPSGSDSSVNPDPLANVYNQVIGATQVWNLPNSLQGQGIGVAVVDSGINPSGDLYTNMGVNRQIANVRFNTDYNQNTSDGYGHGTHVSSVIGGDGSDSGGKYIGVAPMVNIINVKVSNDDGSARTSDVVQGLQWVLNNKDAYNIRVVNLSFNSTVAESYHTSALDAAVEILWFNKIVVVVSAGNQSTGVVYPPANDPFVITVGATDDKGTSSLDDDAISSFSAYGTTEDGIQKPDLVAPGKNIIARLVNTNMGMASAHPGNVISGMYFKMSGTSVSAPMVSGAVALLLQDEPSLTPDQVKYRLTTTANKNWGGYNSSKAGAGYLDIYAAVMAATTDSANTSLIPSHLLSTGTDPITFGSVGWNSVGWNSVGWNSVGWNSVGWNSVGWNSDYWGQ
jgi:serine protease AprX